MATGLDFNIPARALAGQYDPSETIGQQFRLKSLMQQQQMQQTQFDQQQQDREDRRSLRGLVGQYVTGSPEQRGAVMPQIAGIDPDAAVRLMDWSQKASDAEKAAVLQAQKNIAVVTESLRSLPQERRGEALQRFAPGLIQRGATPEMLSGLDLSDTGLDVLRNQAIGITGVIEQGNKDRTYALDTAKFGYQQQNDATNRAVTMRGQNITMRGQDMTDARAQQTAGVNKPPAGYRYTSDGNLQPIPGGPADKANKQEAAYSQSALDAFDRAIESGNRLLTHPGMKAAVGAGIGKTLLPFVGPIPGTERANFAAELDAMKAQVFLPMVQSMKGMGALSNAEGQKLTDAIGALDTNMSETAFAASLNRIITDLETYKARGSATQKTPSTDDPLGLR